MRKELVIEWRHAGRDSGEISEETGMTLAAIFAEIRMLLEMEGVTVRMIEEVAEPESLRFNGIPVEELLEGIEVTAVSCSCTSCDSCEGSAECRLLRYSGEKYNEIPPELIGRAAAKALEVE